MKNKEFGGLDDFKMAAAFLVVAIHTSPLTSFHAEADFIVTRIIARVAVPFFLMVTGYFLLPRYVFGKSQDLRQLFGYLKKVLFLYILAVILYLPLNLYAGQLQGAGAGDFLRMAVFDGTFYHLWYLPASLTGLLLLGLLCCGWKLPVQAVGGITVLLYIIGLFGDSYYGFIVDIRLLREAYDAMFGIFSYTRNGIFYVPVFLFMGAWISQMRWRGRGMINAIGFLLSFALMIAEGLSLHRMEVQRHDSMYLALLPCMFFLFQMVLSIKAKPRECLRSVSTWIYLIHPWMIIIVRGGAKAMHLETILIENSLIHYLAVCILSSLFAVFIWLMQNRWTRRNNPSSQKARAWIELNRSCLRHNIAVLNSLLPTDGKLMPAIKANAYGHGAVLLAKEMNQCGIKSFCTATLSEAVELRKKGIKGEILILGYTSPEQFPLLRRYHLMQTVVDFSYAKTLNNYGKKVKVHIKIDTGMHRLGERFEKINEIYKIFRCKNLVIEGLYTHLSAADTTALSDRAFTEAQGQAFFHVIEKLKKRGCNCPKIHLQASYGILNYPELAGDYARVGIALYGVLSNREDIRNAAEELQPVLSLKARVAAVKDLFQGESAGYGFQYTADSQRKIAVLTIGYADGLPRALSNGRGQAIINGQKAAIIGYICMDQTIVDVTDIPNVRQGDVATIIGEEGDCRITVYDLAEQAGTITNVILSGLGSRLGRVMVG